MNVWRDLLVVVGVCLLVYAAAGFSGSVSGSWDDTHQGSIAGDMSYARAERLQITAGAALLAIGLLARRRERR